MKVDFLSDYKSISELIKRPASQSQRLPDESTFKNLLARIAPGAAEHPEINNKSEKMASLRIEENVADKGPMASFHFPPPQMQTQQFQPIDLSSDETPGVSEPGGSVKTPSVLSVRRVHTGTSSVSESSRSERVGEVAMLMQQSGTYHGIDPALGLGVIQAESDFNPGAVSADGHSSKGLFQLLDATGKELHQEASLPDEYNPFDARQNVELGTRYMRRLHETFSADTELVNNRSTIAAANISSLEKLAVAAFNAGEGRVASAQSRAMNAGRDPSEYEEVEPYLPETTQEYVTRVMQYRDEFERGIFGEFNTKL